MYSLHTLWPFLSVVVAVSIYKFAFQNRQGRVWQQCSVICINTRELSKIQLDLTNKQNKIIIHKHVHVISLFTLFKL